MADRTCIVVADGAHARMFGVENGGEWKLVTQLDYPAGRAKGSDLITDVVTRDRNPREHESERFAQVIAEVLENWAAKGEFDRLILVSPPKFLGMLRNSLPKTVTKLIVDTVAKDLTSETVNELEGRIAAPY